MLYLRTAAGTFVNAASIVALTQRRDQAELWVAVCGDGQELPLARYYSAPGRVERELPHLLRAPDSALPSCHVAAAATTHCSAASCCAAV